MSSQREMPTGPGFGLFFAFGAIVLGWQTYNAYKGGYMYCGVTKRVYREHSPKGFKFWLVVQVLFVLFSIAMSVYGFLT